MALSQFDCLPSDQINHFFFNFADSGYVRPEQARTSYGENNFVLNSGSVFWFLVTYLVIFACLKFTLLVLPSFGTTRILKKLKEWLFYGFFIGLVVEGYIEFVFSTLFQVRSFYEGSKSLSYMMSFSGEAIGLVFAVLIMVSLLTLGNFGVYYSIFILLLKQKLSQIFK